MPFSRLDTAAVARTLSQLAEQPDDVVDAFFERREEVEVAPEGDPGSLRVWREEGFAVRLVRDGHTWLASRDGIEPRSFAEALRPVGLAFSPVTYPEPSLEAPTARRPRRAHPTRRRAPRSYWTSPLPCRREDELTLLAPHSGEPSPGVLV